jgi:hypothetical protein
MRLAQCADVIDIHPGIERVDHAVLPLRLPVRVIWPRGQAVRHKVEIIWTAAIANGMTAGPPKKSGAILSDRAPKFF